MISLGCPKNLVDSEMILGNLFVGDQDRREFALTASPEDADVIVINTCGFIDSAKEESVNTILEACELKERSETAKKVVVAGCVAQRYGTELRKEIPEVDAILGLGEYEDFGSVIRKLFADSPEGDRKRRGQLLRVGDPDRACNTEVGRFRLTPSSYAYVKISEGCDNPCTFCAIPSMRGRFRSKPIPMIEAEVRELVACGAREIVLISQDTTSYGLDVSGRFELPRLLEAISRVEGVEWIRILYAYPAFLTEEMLESIASLDKVVKYIDMPLQHISDTMLRHMGRRLNEHKTRDLLEKTRRSVPGLYLRTTFIVGFPGEDEREYQILRDFVREFEFERLGVFTYSTEEGTPAADFDDAVPEEVSRERLDELMLIQQEIAFRQNRARKGETVEVLVDRVEPERDGKLRMRARSFGEAPEIDPTIRLEPEGLQQVASGDFLTVKITGSRDYDLYATPIHQGRIPNADRIRGSRDAASQR